MEIRPFNDTLREAQGILRVDEGTFGDCYYAAEHILALEADPCQRAWVAEEDGQIVGFVSAFDTHSLDADRWEIDELAVLPACQGRGIGTQLVACAVSDGAPLPGLSQARALIARGNVASQHAFGKNRFSPTADAHLLLYQVSGRVPRPPVPGAPDVRAAQTEDRSAIAKLAGKPASRVAELIERPGSTYLIATDGGSLLGCAELLHVRTLQYEGMWIESLLLAGPDREVPKALFRAAIEEAKRGQAVDRVGYLVPQEDVLVHDTCVAEGFFWVDEYRVFVRGIGTR